MSKPNSITSNFILNALLTASSILFPLITFPYVSRILGPEGTGAVSFASSIISYFTIFAQLGIPVYGVRACARVREDKELLAKTIAEILTINLITCTISYLCFLVMLATVPRMAESREIFLILSASIVLNSLGVEWLYKGLEQYAYITVRSLIFKAISIAAIFLLVRTPDSTVLYAVCTVLALHGSYVINFFHLRKYVSLSSWKHLDLRQHLSPVMVFFAMSVSTTIYTHLDSAMLGFMKTDTDVGYYSTATNVKSLLVNFIASLGTVLLPRVSFYLEKGMVDEFYRLAKKAIHFVVLAAAPLTVYFMLFAKESIYFLASSQFTGSIVPMIIIMPAVFLIGLTNIMGIQMLIPLGKETLVMYSTVVGAVVDLILNLLWIPSYGAAGAAMGTLVAEFAVFLFQLYTLRACARQIFSGPRYVWLFVALIGSSVLSLTARYLISGTFLTLLLSACLFFGFYLVFLFLSKEPLILEFTKKFLKK